MASGAAIQGWSKMPMPVTAALWAFASKTPNFFAATLDSESSSMTRMLLIIQIPYFFVTNWRRALITLSFMIPYRRRGVKEKKVEKKNLRHENSPHREGLRGLNFYFSKGNLKKIKKKK